MQLLDNLIIITLIVLAFFTGKRTADNYNEHIIEELRYQLRLNAAQNGVGYVVPPQRKYRNPIGQDFMDKMKQEGRATQKL